MCYSVTCGVCKHTGKPKTEARSWGKIQTCPSCGRIITRIPIFQGEN